MVVRAGPSGGGGGGGGVGAAAVAARVPEGCPEPGAGLPLPAQSQRLFVFARSCKSWMVLKFRAQLSVCQRITPLS